MNNSDDNWQRVRAIVSEALELPADERPAFIDKACADDRELRDEVESLLIHDADDGFLEQPMLGAGGDASDNVSQTVLEPGSRLGPYEIEELVGAGGMGQVYRARDSRLDRIVAIKVLPGRFAYDDGRRQRFEREARVISGLNHPNICTLHDIGTEQGVDYLVMEYIDGDTLAAALEQEPLLVAAAVTYARQLAEGLARAHEVGIVHRDIKPGNVMFGESGAKLLDFGLAKRSQGPVMPVLDNAGEAAGSQQGPDTLAMSRMTRLGAVMGTAPYMSPEQARGEPVDALADQFSLGATLYEMLTRKRPFPGATTDAIVESVLSESPEPIRQLRPGVPAELEALVMRCLEKDPGKRFSTTAELAEALREVEVRYAGFGGLRLNWRVAAAALLGIVVVGATVTYQQFYDDFVRWTERDTLQAVDALTETGDLGRAFSLLYPIAERLPDDPPIRQRLNRITLPIVINTVPDGARVHMRPYASDEAWIDVGTTPLVGLRIPYAMMDWRIEKDGFATFTGAPFGVASFMVFGRGFSMVPEDEQPPGMVRIPGGDYQRLRFPPVVLDDYWLDKYEVSNREYAEFVAGGGYEIPRYWQHVFVDDARELSFAESMARFVDRDGKPGPAGWQDGGYENDGADMPVRGVSWFEADAYCRFRGKELPTLFHWSAANRQEQLSDIIGVSNFGDGPAPVGERRSLGDFGTYDMAGNVREWVLNESATGRYVLGGAWSDPTYSFSFDTDSNAPWARLETNGLRCARYSAPLDAALTRALNLNEQQRASATVSDELYEAYSRIFEYDKRSLDARVDERRQESRWRYEFVSFDAAYGGERMMAHLFLPLDAELPYQAVVWFPGNDAFLFGAEGPLASPYLFDFIPDGGRALVYPVYKGSYERTMQTELPAGPNEMRDMLAMWSKDLARTLDYLEERDDIDAQRTAYYGFSAGAVYGPILTAIEHRFAASILLGGGTIDIFPPDTSHAAFASRSTVPTLMINGIDDFIMPFATAQRTLFELLGTPPGDKRHARLDGGHIPSSRQELIAEVESWLDRYLGPVN